MCTVEHQNPNVFRFQTEHNGSVVKQFRFQTAPKFERSSLDFRQCQKSEHPSWDTRLDCFIYTKTFNDPLNSQNDQAYLSVWKPNVFVRISTLYEIWTSISLDFCALLYLCFSTIHASAFTNTTSDKSLKKSVSKFLVNTWPLFEGCKSTHGYHFKVTNW